MTSKYEQYTDAELLELYKRQMDGRALGHLLERYTLLVFGVCMKYLKNTENAKDAAQQVFEKVILEVEKYPIPYFKSWLYSVAKNHCLMYLRSAQGKNKLKEIDIEGLELEDDQDAQVKFKEFLLEENIQRLEEAISMLNKEQAICIELFYLKKLTYKEIESSTGMNFQQVKSHLQNAKRNLKLLLEKQMH